MKAHDDKAGLPLPDGACDTHLHVYDERFPAHQNPKALRADCTAERYLALRKGAGLQRAVIVTPQVYVTDNRVTLHAIGVLGREHTRGIAVLHPGVSDEALRILHEGGIRGIRFTLRYPETAVTTFEMLEPLARRVAPLGWHVVLNVTPEQIVRHQQLLRRLPCQMVFDHMAQLSLSGPQQAGAREVVWRLLEDEQAWIKLSGAYFHGTAPGYRESVGLAREIAKHAASRVLWGSDWPHVTETLNHPIFHELIWLLEAWISDKTLRRKILVDNPARLYGF